MQIKFINSYSSHKKHHHKVSTPIHLTMYLLIKINYPLIIVQILKNDLQCCKIYPHCLVVITHCYMNTMNQYFLRNISSENFPSHTEQFKIFHLNPDYSRIKSQSVTCHDAASPLPVTLQNHPHWYRSFTPPSVFFIIFPRSISSTCTHDWGEK